MTDHAVLPPSTRDPIDRISDATLLKPLRSLSGAERGMIRRALQSDRRPELLGRWANLKGVDLPKDDSNPG